VQAVRRWFAYPVQKFQISFISFKKAETDLAEIGVTLLGLSALETLIGLVMVAEGLDRIMILIALLVVPVLESLLALRQGTVVFVAIIEWLRLSRGIEVDISPLVVSALRMGLANTSVPVLISCLAIVEGLA